MKNQPFRPPAEVGDGKTESMRIVRARRILFAMALIVIATLVFEVINHNLKHGWQNWPWQGVRTILPLFLIASIWRGRNWARFALALFCLAVLSANWQPFVATPQMMEKEQFANAVFIVLVFVGHLAIGLFALFSPAISALIEYRREEQDMES